MTRVNLVDVEMLSDQHLFSEWREIKMVPASLRRTLRSPRHKSTKSIIATVPSEFCLNKGHVTFFYDKLDFLGSRYAALSCELHKRKYQLGSTEFFLQFTYEIPDCFFNDWTPNLQDVAVSAERIITKIMLRPEWYKHNKQPLSSKFYNYYIELL